ncbi:MAG: hypothetical protein M1541_21495 [Acidobacteria bacterium]|nr:hypothetical protein [Acidobacteriota bacterium]
MSQSGELLRTVREDVRGVRALLERATAANLDECRPLLERAAASMRGLRPEAGGDELRQDLDGLRREVGVTARLLEAAARFHLGRLQVLVEESGGYSAGGGPASVEPERHAWCEG